MKMYENPEIEIMTFAVEDVITTSDEGREEELPVG